MRQGFRVIDADTHVYPALDVLLRHADKDLLDRADELAPYTRTDGEQATRRLMSENAARFFRLSNTPWAPISEGISAKAI